MKLIIFVNYKLKRVLRISIIETIIMKKILLSLVMTVFFISVSFASGERYIVFFAETSEIAPAVLDKIIHSKRFCMTVPMTAGSRLSAELEELVSYGKIELSLFFDPEPVFPVLASVYSSGGKKSVRQSGFGDYVKGNTDGFEESFNKEQFGIFLRSGEVSHNILYYFAGLDLPWINMDNTEEKLKGVYGIDGIPAFSLYKNFPTAKKDVMKWLESKKARVIPVLLTKRHLNNTELMSYIVDLFDGSRYIKPAVPLYITKIKKDAIVEKKTAAFEQVQVKNNVMTKLYTAVSYISDYKDSPDYNEHFFQNAQSELVYLCSYDLLKGLYADKVASRRMFDAAYNNIFRLVGADAPSDKDLTKTAVKSDPYAVQEDEVMHTDVQAVSGGVHITNDGKIKTLSVILKEGATGCAVSFESGQWDEKISYVDIYIDMNNLDGAGSTSMLPEVKGFLTPDSGWEYAVRMSPGKALLYRHSAEGSVFLTELPSANGSVSIPNKYIRGNPVNWGYQAIAVAQDGEKNIIKDFLNQSSQSKSSLLSVRPFQIPAVRLKR